MSGFGLEEETQRSMQRPEDPRIDLAELKVHFVKKIGAERSRRYFYYLGKFLSQKLTKCEFEKSCKRLLGRENLALHNKLIRSILRNASLAKSPPPAHQTGHPDKSLVLSKEDRPEQSGSLIPNRHVWSNGVLTKVRSGTCDRTIKDRPNGRVESLLHQKLCREDKSFNKNTQNGDLGHFSYQSSGRYADERGGTFLCPAEKMRIPDKGQVAAQVSRDDEAQEGRDRLLSTSHVLAPLGISFCSASVGGDRRTVSVPTRADDISCYDSGGLLDTEMLRKRIENIAVAQGLGGVSAECSSMLSIMLDLYLKKLIKSCFNLAEARSMSGMLIQTSNQPSDITQEQNLVSLLDLRVAVELNAHQLGEDWTLLRERISMRTFEEQEGV